MKKIDFETHFVTHEWVGVNVVLTMDPPWEEICGSVPLKGTLCRVIPER